MLDYQSFFRFVAFLCLVPAAVFATGSEDESTPSTPVACASSHPQFAEQIENTPATHLEVASTTPVVPETHEVATEQTLTLLNLPTELLERILLFACKDDARPKRFEKDWARLRWVCKTFNTTIKNCPAIWAQINMRLHTIERTNDFLTLCPFKDLLHVTVNLDASNQAIFDVLKAAMAKNPNHFTLSATNPTENQLQTLGAQSSPLHTRLNKSFDFDLNVLTPLLNLQHLELNYLHEQTPKLEHPRLKTLIVEGCAGLTSLSEVNLPRLSVLKINLCRGLTHLPLASVPNLKTLKVMQCRKLNEITVEGLNNLQVATFELNPYLTHLSMDQLPMLQALEVLTCLKLDQLNLGTLPKLQSVKVQEADSLQMFAANDLPCFEVITFTNCNALTNLSLAQLPGFQTLSCSNCKNLSTLSLEEVPSFQTLQLFCCPQLKQLSVNKTPKLEKITLKHCAKIETLAIPGPLPNLHTAKFINCGNAVGAEIVALKTQATEYNKPVKMWEGDY